MKRFIQGESRTQSTLLPVMLDDYIADTNHVGAVDVFVDDHSLGSQGFAGVAPAATGRRLTSVEPSRCPAACISRRSRIQIAHGCSPQAR